MELLQLFFYANITYCWHGCILILYASILIRVILFLYLF